MNLRPVAFSLAIVTLVAFAFLIPIVPFSTSVYTGLSATQPLPSISCSPSNSTIINPTLTYQGYESATHYLIGLGVVVYTQCSTSGTYPVEFVQESNCPYGSWLIPWAVEVNHQTFVQPSNATLPLTYSSSRLTSNSAYSTIWFSLPNGRYNYSVIPNDPLGTEQSGSVTVDGSKVTVQVYAFITSMGCSTTTTAAGG